MNWFINLNVYIQTLIATTFTFLITLLGASVVFFFKKVNKTLLDAMLGFASGVMIAASFFSLLNPALDMANILNINSWLICSIGFICGGLFLFISDKIFRYKNKKDKRIIMLISSITIHNIPEGMAIGVAFGSIAYGLNNTNILGAIILTIGIGLQNFTEGSAVSLPLRRDGLSSNKAFLLGSLSGIIEPISGLIGVLLILKIRLFLPFLLSFAAGAMIYVVIEELIPESQTNKKKDLMAFTSIIGFTIMMILDIALG